MYRTRETTDKIILTLAWGIFILLALIAGGCAHGGSGSHISTQMQPPVMSLPICGFEEPYLPDPCRKEITPGEWLRISNPQVRATKHHGWLWWFFLALVTI